MDAQNINFMQTNDSMVGISNSKTRLEYNLKRGTYSIYTSAGKTCLFEKGVLRIETPITFLQSDIKAYIREQKISEISDSIGIGKNLTIRCFAQGKPDLIQQFIIYDNEDFIVLNAGVKNNLKNEIRIMSIHPAIGISFPKIGILENLRLLDGNGGGDVTEVKTENNLRSRNNILATFTSANTRYSMVLGGLTYNEFEKDAEITKIEKGFKTSIWNHDDYGKLIKSGETYLPNDKIGVCFTITDPFIALEHYGLLLKQTQKVHLNYYDFPSVCLWYASHPDYGMGEKLNSSSVAVKEMENIKKSGFLKYSRAAVRLVPDCYEENNQQGWWDDEHWQKIKNAPDCAVSTCYDKPYETSKKWAQKIIELGGIPLTYFQTAARSEDFCDSFPQYMLYNNPALGKTFDGNNYKIWATCPYLSYDFTDTGFVKRMEGVYANLRNAGIAGMMFDYPFTGWSKGGYDNPYATASSVYRKIFTLAHTGMGENCYIDERNCQTPNMDKGSDITLGVIASQRDMGDNDVILPFSVSISGLRWYKNRVVVNYDADAKNPFRAKPDNRDARRAMYTMSYVATGRLLLGVSFAKFNADDIFDLSRTFPYHTTPQSARPVDAFITPQYPTIYDFKISEQWHQLTLYNYKVSEGTWPRFYEEFHKGFSVTQIEKTFTIDLSGENVDGKLNLDPNKEYYFYDFWNNNFIRKIKGNGKLEQTLRPAEARMISIHEVENNPQFISTNRHIMQGYIDMKDCKWNATENELQGTSSVVGGETYTIVVALNGYKYVSAKTNFGKIKVSPSKQNNELVEVSIDSDKNETAKWSVKFKK